MAGGAVWLPLESYEGITNNDVSISFVFFVFIVFIVGILFFFADGYLISGYLKKKINVKSKSFNTKITVKFGDLFSESGWRAIGVNDFFDSLVDDELVSSNSLHGYVIQNFWSDDSAAWQAAIDNSLQGKAYKKTKREKGNKHRFPIGTTADAEVDGNKFLFVALARTKKSDNVVQASAETLVGAIRGLLQHESGLLKRTAEYSFNGFRPRQNWNQRRDSCGPDTCCDLRGISGIKDHRFNFDCAAEGEAVRN